MKLIEGNRSSMDESSLVGCKAGVGSECENPGKASLKGVEVALVLKKVSWWYVVEPQRSGGVALIDHASPLTMALWG